MKNIIYNSHFMLKVFRKLMYRSGNCYTNEFVEYFDQEANDYVKNRIVEAFNNRSGLMISKFGTIELNNVCCAIRGSEPINKELFFSAAKGEGIIYLDECFQGLCTNAGFFPDDIDLVDKYKDLVLADCKEIDILGSYLKQEKYLAKELAKTVRVNLEGYYAPFCWNNPWTGAMKGKRVLVVHPFKNSIEQQYLKREKLFENREVLPEFKSLSIIKAVQSVSGNETRFKDWFDALEYMKEEIDKTDYDIALIGCGAYGMDLAAHVKRKGKVAVHLAGWTQMLFGIYGNRWIQDQPKFKRFINESWVRPLDSEKPQNAEKIEQGCYW